MRSPFLRFQEMLRRLGLDGSEYPEILGAVQPVMEVANVSGLVPTLPPPTSLVGAAKAGGGLSTSATSGRIRTGSVGVVAVGQISLNAQSQAKVNLAPWDDRLLTTFGTPVVADDLIIAQGGVGVLGVDLLLGAADNGLMPDTVPQLAQQTNQSALVEIFIPPGHVYEWSWNAVGTQIGTAYFVLAAQEIA